MITADSHIHTNTSIDAMPPKVADVRNYAQKATEIGLDTLCFTNHVMFIDEKYMIHPEQFAGHVREVETVQQDFPQLEMRTGLEVDYFYRQEGFIRHELRRFEKESGRKLDLVLGSIHWLSLKEGEDEVLFNKKSTYDENMKGVEQSVLVLDYFSKMRAMIDSGLYDVVAHADLFRKYWKKTEVGFSDYKKDVEDLCRRIIEKGMGVEINTACVDREMRDFFPSKDFLGSYIKQCSDKGVRPILTVGSDSHDVSNLGRNFSDAETLLVQQFGVKEIAVYRERKPEFVRID